MSTYSNQLQPAVQNLQL